jgi:hypothetical protein
LKDFYLVENEVAMLGLMMDDLLIANWDRTMAGKMVAALVVTSGNEKE